MNALDVISVIAAAIAEIGKLIVAGVPKREALKRVRRIGLDIAQVDKDVDGAGR